MVQGPRGQYSVSPPNQLTCSISRVRLVCRILSPVRTILRTISHTIFLVLLLALALGCAAPPTRSPNLTPLPTLAQPEDLSHQALAEALSEIEYDLAQARSLLVYMAKSAQVQTGTEQECETFVRGLLKTNAQYTQLGAASPNGVLYCDSEERTRQVSVADRLYFSRAMNEHQFVVGEYVIGRVTLAPSMGLAYPVLDAQQKLRGVVIAPLRLSWLAQRFAEINIPVTGEMVIIDTYGNLLLRDPDANDWFGKNIADTPLGRTMLDKTRGSGEFAGADGEMRFYSFDSPTSANKSLIVGVGIKK